MYCVRKVTNDLYWVGANDHRLALFENCFPIPRGVSYNAYCLLDEKTVLFDTVDWSACRQLLENLEYVLNGRELDYLLVNHLEPDHAACIEEILLRHPKVKLISNEKAFMLMRQFGFHVDGHECIEVKEGDTFSFGKHTVTFVGAPMVHWPEAMVTLDVTDGVLFSADAFGTFGALDGKLFADGSKHGKNCRTCYQKLDVGFHLLGSPSDKYHCADNKNCNRNGNYKDNEISVGCSLIDIEAVRAKVLGNDRDAAVLACHCVYNGNEVVTVVEICGGSEAFVQSFGRADNENVAEYHIVVSVKGVLSSESHCCLNTVLDTRCVAALDSLLNCIGHNECSILCLEKSHCAS